MATSVAKKTKAPKTAPKAKEAPAKVKVAKSEPKAAKAKAPAKKAAAAPKAKAPKSAAAKIAKPKAKPAPRKPAARKPAPKAAAPKPTPPLALPSARTPEPIADFEPESPRPRIEATGPSAASALAATPRGSVGWSAPVGPEPEVEIPVVHALRGTIAPTAKKREGGYQPPVPRYRPPTIPNQQIPTPASIAAPMAPAVAPVAMTPSASPEPEAAELLSTMGADLPEEYGETQIALMVRDPEWIFAYWEIADGDRRSFGLDRGEHNRPLLIRLYDVTGVSFDGGNAVASHDVPVNDFSNSWYVRVPEAGRTYIAELGTFADSGEFRAICRSNAVAIPEAQLSPIEDPKWRERDDELYRQVLALSGGVELRERVGSEEFSRSLQRRLRDNVSSASAGLALSSGALGRPFRPSSESALRRAEKPAGPAVKDRGFWLRVGVEVIVYGATEPDAKVRFMGQDIALGPDGTFRLRTGFPDGVIEFPVEATSGDGVETRKVCPIVHRKTVGSVHEPV